MNDDNTYQHVNYKLILKHNNDSNATNEHKKDPQRHVLGLVINS